MYCSNGANGTKSCKLKTSKSVKIIESCLLGYLQAAILTEDFLTAVVQAANEYLAKDAARPRPNVQPLRSKARRLRGEVDRLFNQLDGMKEDSARRAFERRIGKRQRDLDQIQEKLNQAEAECTKTPPPLDPSRVPEFISDLRELLNDDIPAAAKALRALTGKIVVQQQLDPTRKKGAPWTATFAPDVVQLLRGVAHLKHYPETVTLEYLFARKWIVPQEVTVSLGQVPKYEALAPVFLALKRKGTSIKAIAAAYGMCWSAVREIIRFAETGERPRWNKPGRKHRKAPAANKTNVPPIKEIAPLLVELLDAKQMTLRQAKQALLGQHGIDVSKSTLSRAYDFARPELAQQACKDGKPIRSRKWTFLAPEQHQKIRKLLRRNKKPREIAKQVGCSVNTVTRAQKKLRRS